MRIGSAGEHRLRHQETEARWSGRSSSGVEAIPTVSVNISLAAWPRSAATSNRSTRARNVKMPQRRLGGQGHGQQHLPEHLPARRAVQHRRLVQLDRDAPLKYCVIRNTPNGADQAGQDQAGIGVVQVQGAEQLVAR